MKELRSIQLKTLGWAIVPLVGLVIVPWGLRRLVHELAPVAWDVWQWVGVWLILNGAGLAGWCVYLFNVAGEGTPLPTHPPRRFVATGPYRVVRNPMALGLVSIVLGQAVACQSWVVGAYALLLITGVHLFVRFWEEPDLARRFGDSYRAYRQQVPRWVPKLPLRR